MSSFYTSLKHRESGEYHKIFAIDDWFGRHIYGFRLPDDTVLDEEDTLKIYEPRELDNE